MQRIFTIIVLFLFFSFFQVFAQPGKNPRMPAEDYPPTGIYPERSVTFPRLSVSPPVRTITPRSLRLTLTPRPTISIPFVKRDEKRKKYCLRLQEAVNKRQGNLTRMVENLNDVFTAIISRVDEYYQSRLIPEGKTVANYQRLMNTIETSQKNLNDKLLALENTVETTDCEGDNPGFVASVMKDQVQELITAMHEYKRTVRNLIVAVHTAGIEVTRPTQTTATEVTPVAN